MLELILQTRHAERVAAVAFEPGQQLHAPHLVDLEVAHSLRRLVQLGQITVRRADEAIEDFRDLTIERHEHAALLGRIWHLRAALTAYDGAYIALAEVLQVPLVTCDGRLRRAHGHGAEVILIGGSN